MPDVGSPEDPGGNPQAASPAASGDPGREVLAALSSCLIAWQQAESWLEFFEPLAAVEDAAIQAGHLALHDVCVILHERILQLSDAHARPDDEQCAVLATWPSFASNWVESRGEPQLGEPLVAFLQHPMWPQPLGDDEADGLGVMLGVESGAYGSESLLDATIGAMDTAESDAHAGVPDGSADDGLPGYDGLSGYAKLGTATGGAEIVPDVRANMAGGMDDDASEDPGAGVHLHRIPPRGEFEDPGAAESRLRLPEAPDHAFTEPAFVEAGFSDSELAEPEAIEAGLADPEIAAPETVDAARPDPEFTDPEAVEAALSDSEYSEPGTVGILVAGGAPVTATPMVRVPAPLMDKLLRLVGETIILTRQIQERLDLTARDARTMRKQYTLVQQLGREMEELIDRQDLSLPQTTRRRW